MLAITKRHQLLKTVSAGTLAFAIGLTSAAAYVGSTVAHQNLTFSKEQKAASDTSETARAGTVSGVTNDTAPTGSSLYAPTSTFAESPMLSAPASSQVTAAPTTGQVVQTATTPVPPAATAPVESPSSSTGPNDNTLILCTDLPLLTLPIPGSNCRY